MARVTAMVRALLARPSVLAAALTLFVGCGQAAETAVPADSSSEPSSPAAGSAGGEIHGTFEVGGHELFLDCTGTGSPTVVMLHGIIRESGSGGDSVAWDATRGALETRSCAYDRRNVGLSEQVPGRSTAIDAIEDLHGLLQAADVDPPYVLAGDSFGGLLSLLYAGTYPDEVAGIVLVDATLPLEWALDPPEIIPEVKIEQNSNDERIDFYGAGPTTDAVLDSLPNVPITYMFALQQDYPKEWAEGAYFAALRRFVRSLPEGKLVKFDTDHFMLDNIPADVADQIQQVVGRSGV